MKVWLAPELPIVANRFDRDESHMDGTAMNNFLSHMSRIPAKLAFFIAILTPSFSCETKSPSADDQYFSVASEEGNVSCVDSPCEPAVIDMCTFMDNEPELVLIGRVTESKLFQKPCEERTWKSWHYEQRVEILHVAVGSFSSPTIDIVDPIPTGGGDEVGDISILRIRELDGVWLASKVPIELQPDGTSTATPDDRGGDEDSVVIYDFPNTFGAFAQEARAISGDFPNQCGRSPQPWTDQELRDRVYNDGCPADSDQQSEETQDGVTDDEL